MDEHAPATDAFLEAEAAADRLVESLERLRTEAERRGAAATNLAEATSVVRELADLVAQTNRRTAEAAEVLRAIGMPVIIEGMDKSRNAIVQAVEGSGAATSEALQRLQESLAGEIASLRSGVESLRVSQGVQTRRLVRLLWVTFAIAASGALAGALVLIRGMV